ncbi:MAG: hypothetical protein E7671_02470 [Ruminococcaceae bacterium]|nr:hypothetical protein [Oscillospiraceae bacterium]
MKMLKTICGKTYDTDNATLIKRKAVGVFGDPAGYEESLYQTEGGLYFLYLNGGENSPYKKEDIKRMSKANAEKWLAE